MKITTLFILFVALSAGSCGTLKPGYAYMIGHPDSTLFGGSYISYGTDVLEYSIKSVSSPDKQWLDTTGIHYLDGRKRMFATFSSLKDSSSILRRGRFSEKKDGLQLADTLFMAKEKMTFEKMKDTIFAGTKLVYAVQKASLPDSLALVTYYLPRKDFTSIYDLVPYQAPDKNHHPVGMDLLVHGKPSPELHATLTSFRPLSRAERKTCEKLRKRAQVALNE